MLLATSLSVTPSEGFPVALLLGGSRNGPAVARRSAPSDADFEKPRAVSDGGRVDPDRYNVPLKTAAELWTVSVSRERNADREAGVPFLDTTSKDHYVDDVRIGPVSRDGGLGIELIELAGGREDGVGVTVVEHVVEGGNAARAGLLPGDSIAAVLVVERARESPAREETRTRVRDCECRDFDRTIDALANFPADAETIELDVKRVRRWPKVRVKVEYPPSQCAEGVDNVRYLDLYAGENLRRALLNRRIVMDDPGNPQCDYCGSNACYVSVSKGRSLLNPMGTTEEKLMKRNPNVRLSCKTTVGYNMQEGDLSLRVNLSQWSENER